MHLILFLFITSLCQGQISFSNLPTILRAKGDSVLLLGDWQMVETLISPGLPTNPIPVIRKEATDRRLFISRDSLVFIYDGRFYKRRNAYNYQLDNGNIKILSPSKRSLKITDEFRILTCTYTDLVIEVNSVAPSFFDGEELHLTYHFQRPDSTMVDVKRLMGFWYTAKSIKELSSEPGSIFQLQRTATESKFINGTTLSFEAAPSGMECLYVIQSITSSGTPYSAQEGVYPAPKPFFVDPVNNLVFMSGQSTNVYEYRILSENSIELTFVRTE